MNTKRIVRWVIVLFLLAALPGLTAALAQGQEPAKFNQQAPAAEKGESTTTIPWSNDEYEPNNSIYYAQVYLGPDVTAGGTIGYDGDEDYWLISAGYYCDGCPEGTSYPVLFNIDARSFASPVDTVICLYSDDGLQLACNDDMQGADNRDSLLYYNLEYSRDYFLSVRDYYGDGGSDYRYQLLVSTPLLISAAAANLGTGTVDGIPFQSGDILAWSSFRKSNVDYEKWVMLLDISDLGVKGNLTNLSAGWRNSDFLLVGFAANATLPGITGPVNPWEVVVFDPSQVGPNTSGTFQRWWNGKQHSLTLAAEKLDAIDWPAWNGLTRLFVSTTGAASVKGGSMTSALKLADEDVGLWHTNETWQSADVSLFAGLAQEDVIGLSELYETDSMDDWYHYFLVIQGTGMCRDVLVTQKDILDALHYIEWNGSHIESEGWVCYREWHGPDHGWNYNIDAIDYRGW